MTLILILASIVLVGGVIYLRNKYSVKKATGTIANIVKEAKEIQAKAQAEVKKAEEPAAKPKRKSAPRKKKETTSVAEGPIKGEYYKQVR